jgi:hypothetical protein
VSEVPEMIVTDKNEDLNQNSESDNMQVVDISIEQSEVGVRMEDQQATQHNEDAKHGSSVVEFTSQKPTLVHYDEIHRS